MYIDFTHVTASNRATDDVTIRSCVESLIQNYNILVLILYSKLMRNIAALAVFDYDIMMILNSGLLFGHLVYTLLRVALR